MSDPGSRAFYARPVTEVAADLLGCVVRYQGAAGRIVEVESYHETEPACHAFTGLTERTRVLFGPPGHAYVYRCYGVHALLNFVAEDEGVGAAVLVRALEPLEGLGEMERRRGPRAARDLCSGPGKLTQALGIWLECNGASLESGPIAVEAPAPAARLPAPVSGVRVGITRAIELEWRLCDASSDCVSRPCPPAMRRPRRSRAAA